MVGDGGLVAWRRDGAYQALVIAQSELRDTAVICRDAPGHIYHIARFVGSFGLGAPVTRERLVVVVVAARRRAAYA